MTLYLRVVLLIIPLITGATALSVCRGTQTDISGTRLRLQIQTSPVYTII